MECWHCRWQLNEIGHDVCLSDFFFLQLFDSIIELWICELNFSFMHALFAFSPQKTYYISLEFSEIHWRGRKGCNPFLTALTVCLMRCGLSLQPFLSSCEFVNTAGYRKKGSSCCEMIESSRAKLQNNWSLFNCFWEDIQLFQCRWDCSLRVWKFWPLQQQQQLGFCLCCRWPCVLRAWARCQGSPTCGTVKCGYVSCLPDKQLLI